MKILIFSIMCFWQLSRRWCGWPIFCQKSSHESVLCALVRCHAQRCGWLSSLYNVHKTCHLCCGAHAHGHRNRDSCPVLSRPVLSWPRPNLHTAGAGDCVSRVPKNQLQKREGSVCGKMKEMVKTEGANDTVMSSAMAHPKVNVWASLGPLCATWSWSSLPVGNLIWSTLWTQVWPAGQFVYALWSWISRKPHCWLTGDARGFKQKCHQDVRQASQWDGGLWTSQRTKF